MQSNQMNPYYITIILIIVMLACNTPVRAESVNYCDHKETNQQWEQIVNNNSGPEIKEMYLLRNRYETN